MTLKQEVHTLVDALPDDSPQLAGLSESLRMSRALEEGFDDVKRGRTYDADVFLEKVRKQWPRKTSA
ncbi:hypothetical protein [Geminisphaera colitermitum]|uniref:hypothetical protein n=1 Tax=Geminisphaera colitermitum TaxID=1148786 RepID=UPI0005B8A207|nr:hypothetical protein [Geminisphaera colitermitum]RRJ98644.1 hypothetical protein Ga0100230_009810 [Opitutaceae bacterium TAV3]